MTPELVEAMVARSPRWARMVAKGRQIGYDHILCTEREQRNHLAFAIRMRRTDRWIERRFEPELQQRGLTFSDLKGLMSRYWELGDEVRLAMHGPPKLPFPLLPEGQRPKRRGKAK